MGGGEASHYNYEVSHYNYLHPLEAPVANRAHMWVKLLEIPPVKVV